MLVMAVIGLIFAIMWGKTYGKRYKEQQAAKDNEDNTMAKVETKQNRS